jgi:hypothetical protein
MERTLISWNLPNWITVVVMAALGYAALGFVAQMVKRNGGGE